MFLQHGFAITKSTVQFLHNPQQKSTAETFQHRICSSCVHYFMLIFSKTCEYNIKCSIYMQCWQDVTGFWIQGPCTQFLTVVLEFLLSNPLHQSLSVQNRLRRTLPAGQIPATVTFLTQQSVAIIPVMTSRQENILTVYHQ